MLRVGNVVTITKEPSGVNGHQIGLTGVIAEKDGNDFLVITGTSAYWYGADEFKPATTTEMKNCINDLLMPNRKESV